MRLESKGNELLRIATLGPEGTNHELVAHRYMAHHSIENYEIRLVDDFSEAVAAILAEDVDIIIQCAVHPATPETMGCDFHRVFASDCFIADSQELGVVTRRDVEDPKTLGILLPANESYVDTSQWASLKNLRSLPLILRELLDKKLDSGLTYTHYAASFADQLRLDEVIGSPDDVWIVYSRCRTSSAGAIIANTTPLFAGLLHNLAEGKQPTMTPKGDRKKAE